MGEDQTADIRAFLAAVHQIFGNTKRKIQVPSVEVVHPLAPRDANKFRGVTELFPQCASARVTLTSLGSSPAANSKSDRTKIGLKVEFLPLTLLAIGK
jgi:hypothetical protein